MIDIFLSKPTGLNFDFNYESGQVGYAIKQYYNDVDFVFSKDIKIALIGVDDFRNSFIEENQKPNIDEIRNSLFKLYMNEDFVSSIVDLGNINKGLTFNDTEYALQETLSYLLKNNVLPIVFGGGKSLTYAMFKSYQSLEQSVNLLSVDSKIYLGDLDSDINKDNFLGKILVHQPNFLLNFCNLAYQTYYTNPIYLELLEQLNFDAVRLGKMKADFKDTEPYVRNADIISFDLGAIKKGDVEGVNHASPNGLLADEACQLMRYGGLSDKLSSVGIFECHNFKSETANLIAQMIWYFIDGYHHRKGDFPISSKNEYTKFLVNLTTSDKQLVFYKSNLSERWWMEVPYPLVSNSKFEKHRLIPCSYKDYQEAMKDEIPEKWLHAIGKI